MAKTILLTFLIIGFLGFAIGIIYLVGGKRSADVMDVHHGVRMILAGLLFILCSPACAYAYNICQSANDKYEAQVAEIQENADTLTFYLDGEEVGYETVDLSQYKISYSPEEKKVYMTRKSSSHRFFVPIYYGR